MCENALQTIKVLCRVSLQCQIPVYILHFLFCYLLSKNMSGSVSVREHAEVLKSRCIYFLIMRRSGIWSFTFAERAPEGCCPCCVSSPRDEGRSVCGRGCEE